MSNYVSTKRIIVKSYGHLFVLGGINGPIKTPILLPTTKIASLINTKADVYEVLEDGTEVKLDLKNYNIKNTAPKKEEKVFVRNAEVPKKAAENVEAKAEEKKSTATEIKITNNNQNNNQNNNLNNQKNKNKK